MRIESDSRRISRVAPFYHQLLRGSVQVRHVRGYNRSEPPRVPSKLDVPRSRSKFMMGVDHRIVNASRDAADLLQGGSVVARADAAELLRPFPLTERVRSKAVGPLVLSTARCGQLLPGLRGTDRVQGVEATLRPRRRQASRCDSDSDHRRRERSSAIGLKEFGASQNERV